MMGVLVRFDEELTMWNRFEGYLWWSFKKNAASVRGDEGKKAEEKFRSINLVRRSV